MFKRLLSLVIIMSLLISMIPIQSFSVAGYDVSEAKQLSLLGLFKGSDLGFELDRAATRVESAAILVRLLGAEQDALSSIQSHPFTDVPNWASPYVGKLVQLKLTTGKTAELYGAKEYVTAKEFAVFLMRSLGYLDGVDFTWQSVFERALALGIFTNLDIARYQSGDTMLRGDIVHLLSRTLTMPKKGTTFSILDTLVLQKRVDVTAAAQWLTSSIISDMKYTGLSEYEKSLAIHNYIVQSATYGYLPKSIDPNQSLSRTAYGVLALGGGVCGGYSEAYRLLAIKMGLEVKTVVGRANGVDGWNAHAWNMVRIDGQWYHVDATFNDPVGVDVLRFNYLHITDKEIAVDHSWTNSDYPACTATAANYYVRNHNIVSNLTEYKASILSGLSQRVTSIEIKVMAYEDTLYGQNTIYSVMKSSGVVVGYSHTIDEKMGIVRLTNIRYLN